METFFFIFILVENFFLNSIDVQHVDFFAIQILEK
jgi:hypothetical protein